MKAIYIFNEHDSNEVALLERARIELGNYIQDIQVADFQTVRDIYQIAQTPALILIREDLQGSNLLDDVSGQLRVTAELWAAIQQEELVIHQAETHRIDNIILTEVNNAVAPVQTQLSTIGTKYIKGKLAAKRAGVTI